MWEEEGGGSTRRVTRTHDERPGICCCFYGTTDPPQTQWHLFGWLIVCVMRAGVGWGRAPLCPPPHPQCLALFRHFQHEGGGGCGNGFKFQANLREGELGVGGRGVSRNEST